MGGRVQICPTYHTNILIKYCTYFFFTLPAFSLDFFFLFVFFSFFKLDILFIYISNVIPFPSFPSATLSYALSPCFYVGGHSPTHSCLPPLAFPYTRAMSNKVILCYIMQLEPWVPPCVLIGWWFSS